MMTLQNEPPTLESICDERDQYKDYGRSIRRLIGDCLRKEPDKRPTAHQLLKHDFVKKAKDKEYILRTLLQQRVLRQGSKVKRVPGSSGKLHKTEAGEWEWSDEEAEPGDANADTLQASSAAAAAAASARSPRLADTAAPSTTVAASTISALSKNVCEISFVLRLRNDRKELHDIKFDFKPRQGGAHCNQHTVLYAWLSSGFVLPLSRSLVACAFAFASAAAYAPPLTPRINSRGTPAAASKVRAARPRLRLRLALLAAAAAAPRASPRYALAACSYTVRVFP